MVCCYTAHAVVIERNLCESDSASIPIAISSFPIIISPSVNSLWRFNKLPASVNVIYVVMQAARCLCLSSREKHPEALWTCIEAFSTSPTVRRDEINKKQTLLFNWYYILCVNKAEGDRQLTANILLRASTDQPYTRRQLCSRRRQNIFDNLNSGVWEKFPGFEREIVF